MVKFSLTETAKDDLEKLYNYGVLNYGLEQTEQYTSDMITRFKAIAEHPKLYTAVNHIREGYRRSVYGATFDLLPNS